jgi:hypothetical protein
MTILMYSIFMEAWYDGSLEGLFALLDEICRGAPVPDRVFRQGPDDAGAAEAGLSAAQPELFPEGPAPAAKTAPDLPPGGQAGGEEALAPIAAELYEVSAGAYADFLHARMSGLPLERELLLFARRVITAARDAGRQAGAGIGAPEAREAAERAATDRGDPAVLAVLEAAYKVRREIHRLLGLLRFSAAAGGWYHARCAPDYGVLPALAEHFYRRFGETPWVIIDEKRRVALSRAPREEPRLIPWGEAPPREKTAPAGEKPGPADPGEDPWEELWRNYHRAVNNETRKNPGLQRQFMPARYWKYLPEMRQ